MGKNERQAYLQAIRLRYRRARRRTKTTILDEFCAFCGYHRKNAIRLVNRSARGPQPGHPGRPATYTLHLWGPAHGPQADLVCRRPDVLQET